MNPALIIESIIWGGVENIPPQIKRQLGAYRVENEIQEDNQGNTEEIRYT